MNDSKTALPPDHYHIRVNRGPLPTREALAEQFPGGVAENFYNSNLWHKSSVRRENDVTAEDVVILVKDFASEIESGEIELGYKRIARIDHLVDWGLRNGYVPTDINETYAIGIDPQTRDLQPGNGLWSFGSFLDYGNGRYHVVLNSGWLIGRHRYDEVHNSVVHGRSLALDWFDHSLLVSRHIPCINMNERRRFLFVRKQPASGQFAK